MTTTTTKTAFTQVNLLPPETRERQKTRRQSGLVVAAGAAVLVVLGLFYVMQNARVGDLQDKVDAQSAKNATLQAQVTELQPYEQLREGVASRQTLVHTALAGDVSWSEILQDLSSAVPESVWLTSISGTTTPGQAVPVAGTVPTTTTPTESSVIGSLSFDGNGLDTDAIVAWLNNLAGVTGWVNPWVSSAQKSVVGKTPVWSFTSSVDLSPDALSKRGGGNS